ncbi:MAG: SPFH domain-containing protein [Myxococcota bacterium]
METTIGGGIFLAIVLLIFIWRLARLIETVGPNEALIVSGSGEPQVVVGGRKLVWPIINQSDRLSLEVMTIDVHNKQVFTAQGIAMDVDGVAQIAIKNDEASIRTAARQFLGRKEQEVAAVARQTLEGHLRAILGQLTVEGIYKEREMFAQKVQEHASPDMHKMGLTILSFTLRDVKDQEGYLEALGKPRLAAVRRDAQIAEAEASAAAEMARANATRDAAIRTAEANQLGQVAQLQSKAKIAEAERDLKLQLASFNELENRARAKAEAAYEIEKRDQLISVQEKENLRITKELEGTVRSPAEARKYSAQLEADAERYKRETTAQAAKATGLAQAEVDRARGLTEAEIQRAKGLAEAESVRAMGMAEAEAMEKKAEAFKQYNNAAVSQMVVNVLPEIAKAIAAPLANTEKLIVTGGEGGISKLTGDVAQVLGQLPPVVESLTGINLQQMLRGLQPTAKPVEKDPAARASDVFIEEVAPPTAAPKNPAGGPTRR